MTWVQFVVRFHSLVDTVFSTIDTRVLQQTVFQNGHFTLNILKFCYVPKIKTKQKGPYKHKFFPGKLDFVTWKIEYLSLITVVYYFITETQTSIFVLDKLIGLPCRNGFSISFKKLTFCWTIKVVRGHVLDVK